MLRLIPLLISLCLLSLKMDNNTKQVMKNFKRQEAVHEGREKYLNKLKGSISNGATKSGSRDISNASSDATNATTSATNSAASAITSSRDFCIYGVAVVAVLAIGVCVFFVYNETFSQTSNNKLAKE